jgi:magnesium transporter
MERIIYREGESARIKFLAREVKNCWIDLEAPTEKEISWIVEKFGVSKEFILDALDQDEIPRVEKEGRGINLIIRVPCMEENVVKTVPLGIILLPNVFITVHLQKLEILNEFFEGKIKFSTSKKTRLLLQIIKTTIHHYTKLLRACERKIRNIEKSFLKYARNEDIIVLMDIKEEVLDMQNAILENNKIFEAILTGHYITLYKGDVEIIQDLIIDNKQCITMSTSLIKIATNTLRTFEWIISNNLNMLMKKLAGIAVILSVPVIISSFYGMNVGLPLQGSPHAFTIILLVSFLLSLLVAIVFKLKNWI